MKMQIKKILVKSYDLVYSSKLPSLSKRDEKLIEDLRNEAKKIEIINTNNLSGSELEWSSNMNNIITNILNKNPREFLTWEVIRYTMFVVRAKFVRVELSSILKSKFYKKLWKNAIIESNVGKPLRYWRFPKSSGNLIHHLYHLLKFKESVNINFEDLDLVLEFGGGYGSMCRVLYNCNFNKKYILFDLPVFSVIQKFYLKSLGIKVLEPNEFIDSENGVVCISSFETLNQLVSHYSNTGSKLFIGTWSFSETPIDFRSKFMPILTTFDLHLIAYQKNFIEADNINYFNNFKEFISASEWDNFEIEHLPNNYYLFGRRK